jgi:hypothetical protein
VNRPGAVCATVIAAVNPAIVTVAAPIARSAGSTMDTCSAAAYRTSTLRTTPALSVMFADAAPARFGPNNVTISSGANEVET